MTEDKQEKRWKINLRLPNVVFFVLLLMTHTHTAIIAILLLEERGYYGHTKYLSTHLITMSNVVIISIFGLVVLFVFEFVDYVFPGIKRGMRKNIFWFINRGKSKGGRF